MTGYYEVDDKLLAASPSSVADECIFPITEMTSTTLSNKLDDNGVPVTAENGGNVTAALSHKSLHDALAVPTSVPAGIGGHKHEIQNVSFVPSHFEVARTHCE